MMRPQIRREILAFAAASTLAACAATGPSNPSGPGSAISSAPAAAAAPAAKGMKSAYGNYVRVTRNGQAVYCKEERDTATRMMQETCLTQAQMEAQEENARKFMQGTQGIANTPASGPYGH
jgi:hypothetical protein